MDYKLPSGDILNIPLVVDERNIKWRFLGEILNILDSRSVKQEIARQGIEPMPKTGAALRSVFIAMFFSHDISRISIDDAL